MWMTAPALLQCKDSEIAQRRTNTKIYSRQERQERQVRKFNFFAAPPTLLRACFASSFENMGRMGLGHFKQNPSIPSFQHGALESRLTWMSPEASLRA